MKSMKKGILNRSNKGWSRLLIFIVAAVVLLFTTSMTIPEVNSSQINKPMDKPPWPDSVGPQIDDALNAKKHVYDTVQCGVMKYRSVQNHMDQIPLYCISGVYGVSDGPVSSSLNTALPVMEKLYIPPSLQSQMAAFWLSDTTSSGGHLIMAPRGWKVEKADTGANGSVGIEMSDPAHPDRRWIYQDEGGCQGCTISSIGAYFPKLKTWANNQGFLGSSVKFSSQQLLNEHIVTYTLSHKNQGYSTLGAAYQRYNEEGAVFTRLEVSVPKENNNVAQQMIDFFLLNPTYRIDSN